MCAKNPQPASLGSLGWGKVSGGGSGGWEPLRIPAPSLIVSSCGPNGSPTFLAGSLELDFAVLLLGDRLGTSENSA
jgi:hypothetical protein